jgi:exosortase A
LDAAATREQEKRRNLTLPLHWRPATLAVVALLACWGTLYWRSIRAIVNTWNTDATFSHGFLVPVLALLLVWRERHRLASIHPCPTYWGIVFIAVGTMLWAAGTMGYVLVLQEFAVVILLQAALLSILGWTAIRRMLFPLLFLFFAVPFGDSLVSPLQDVTATFLVQALRISGISVLLEDRIVTTPSGNWEVAEACSGMRYLVSSVVLAAFVVHLGFRKSQLHKRILVLLTFILVPIIANGLRAYGIVLLGYITNNRLARGVDHIIYGWIFFGVITFGTIALTSRWRDEIVGQSDEIATAPQDNGSRSSRWQFATAALISMTVLSVGPVLQQRTARQQVTTISVMPLQVSMPWRAIPGATKDWTPLAHAARSEFAQRYIQNASSVDLSIAYYSTQTGGVPITAPWNLVSDKRWVPGKLYPTTIIVDGREVRVMETVIRSAYTKRLVWNWYWVAGQFTGNATYVKYLQARTRLLGGPTVAAVVSVGASFAEDKSEATSILQDFLRHLRLDEDLRAATASR